MISARSKMALFAVVGKKLPDVQCSHEYLWAETLEDPCVYCHKPIGDHRIALRVSDLMRVCSELEQPELAWSPHDSN